MKIISDLINRKKKLNEGLMAIRGLNVLSLNEIVNFKYLVDHESFISGSFK